MTDLATYVADVSTLVATKPADASIPNQSATVSTTGVVSISFVSNDPAVVAALRDWLTTILGD